MSKYVLKRILYSILTLFIVITLTFFLMNAIPGGPFNNERNTEQIVQMMNEKYGLDKPLGVQYVNYMKQLFKGDLGISFTRKGFTVNEIIGEKFPVSARLGVVAAGLAVVLGIPAGVVSALKRNSILDRAIMFVSTLGIALPSFIVASLLMYFLCIKYKIFPTVGLKTAGSYVLPAFSLAFFPMSYVARMMRSNMLDVLGQDYIRTARAKGLQPFFVLFKHALRNSIIPVITYLGPAIAGILTGGFVVEKIFSIPGLGQYFINSITARDYPMVMGTTIFLAALVIMMNFLVDILYSVIDPRIKYD